MYWPICWDELAAVVAVSWQSRHLGGDRSSRVVVQIVGGKSTKCILLEWKGGVISLMACGGGCRIEPTLKGFLDHPTEFDPCLCGIVKLVPIFERRNI